jgi:hypothetical protein
MDLEDARKVLLTDYQINEGVTFISKQEKLQRLKHEIQEFQENFKD